MELPQLVTEQRSPEGASPTTTDSCATAARTTAEEIAAAPAYCRQEVVASTCPDGLPPAAFVNVGGELWLATSAEDVRRRNVAIDRELSLVVTEGDLDDDTTLLIEGPAREVAVADAAPGVAESYERTYGQRPDWAACWLVLRPRRVLSHHGNA